MNVLVTVASRHGSTTEIGHAVAEVLAAEGFVVDVRPPDDVPTLAPYDAVVLGSAVYVGRWAASARAFVDHFASGLAVMPLWLFSSGPVGAPLAPTVEADEIPSLVARLGPRDHRVFAGAMDREVLTLAERAVVALLLVPEGDFRQWDEIASWAHGIAAELHAEHGRLHAVG